MTTRRIRRPIRSTAATVVNTGQLVFFSLLTVLVVVGVILAPIWMAKLAILLILGFFAVFVGLNLILWHVSTRYQVPEYTVPAEDDPRLPRYTVLIPMFREADMVKGMIEGLAALKYPKNKLQVLLLLETPARDPDTWAAVNALALPAFVETIEVPDIKPYGKQKALNIGLAHAMKHAKSEFCVIYDAEDRPEPQQLLKAVGCFRHLELSERTVDRAVACLQAPLRYSNETSSWVSRMMWVEYIIHFEWVLPGFVKLGLVPPLGGTSNHFRTAALKKIRIQRHKLPKGAEGIGSWDPWNVTEDADLAGALALFDYRIAMLDSHTDEVATVKVSAVIPQRSRWLKGYIQTALMFTRRPFTTMRHIGPVRWFVYVLFLAGTPISVVLSLLSWILTVAYFSTRSPAIEQLFPPPLLYLGTLLLVFGNFALFMKHVAAANKRKGFGTVRFLAFLAAWQMLAILSLFKAVRELASPKLRHFWDKTDHGHDLHTLESVATPDVSLAPASAPTVVNLEDAREGLPRKRRGSTA